MQGLADAGLSVQRGFARRGAGSEWIAAFELRRSARSADPMLLDYLELAERQRTPRRAPDLQVTWHQVERDGTGALRLAIQGLDRPGFLAALLERLAFLALMPVELEIATEGDRVADRLVLCSADGGAPTDATLRILGEVLDGRLLGGVAASG